MLKNCVAQSTSTKYEQIPSTVGAVGTVGIGRTMGRFMSFRSLKPGGKCSQTSRRPDSELAKSVSGQLDQSDEALPWHRSISSAQYAQGNIMKRYEKICTVAKMIEKEFSDFQRNVEPC